MITLIHLASLVDPSDFETTHDRLRAYSIAQGWDFGHPYWQEMYDLVSFWKLEEVFPSPQKTFKNRIFRQKTNSSQPLAAVLLCERWLFLSSEEMLAIKLKPLSKDTCCTLLHFFSIHARPSVCFYEPPLANTLPVFEEHAKQSLFLLKKYLNRISKSSRG